METEDFIEELRNHFYDNGDIDLQVELGDEEEINIYLDLPNTENYNYHIDILEDFFRDREYDNEDFSVDGDYEGTITIYLDA